MQATLTKELAEKIIHVVIIENRPFDMGLFIDDVPNQKSLVKRLKGMGQGEVEVETGLKVAEIASYSLNECYHSHIPLKEAAGIICNSPACLSGTAMTLDADISHLCAYVPLELDDVIVFNGAIIDDKHYSEEAYSMRLFGANYGSIIYTYEWPDESSYLKAKLNGDKLLAASIAIIHLRDYCTRYLDFTPDLPDIVLQAINANEATS